MPLTTTTIGAYPKPKQTPIQDWFLGTKSEEERKASKGLLSNWSPGAYEKALESAGADAEKLFLAAIKEVITDQVMRVLMFQQMEKSDVRVTYYINVDF